MAGKTKPSAAKGKSSSAPKPSKVNLKYPADIDQPAWASRCIKIYIKQSPRHHSTSGAMVKKIIDLTKSGLDKINSVAEGNLGISISLDSNKKGKFDRTMGVIALPLPNTFSDSQNHAWNVEKGIWGTVGSNIANENVVGIGLELLEAQANKIPVVGAGAAKLAQIGQRVTSGLSTDKLVGSMSAAAGARRPIIDPGYFQNYTGSDPREFSMKFDFIPQNATEADSIIMIITTLKQFSSPSTQIGGVSLLAPYYFKIDFGNKFMANMINIDRVVIKNISVDYGADGFMQQHADGMPKHIELSLTFAEADMVLAEDYSTMPALPSKSPKPGTVQITA